MRCIFNEGAVTLSFDDGWRCVYENALPILEEAGVKSTHYVISGYLDDEQFPRYMNGADIRNLASRGHEIGCHSASHQHLTTETPSILREEIVLSRRYLENLVGPVETFAYPYGEYDDRVLAAVKLTGFIGARTIQAGFNTQAVDPFLLKCQGVNLHTTMHEIAKLVDSARRQNAWLILTIHQVDHEGRPWSSTPETVRAIARHLVRTGVTTITVRDGLKMLNGSLAKPL